MAEGLGALRLPAVRRFAAGRILSTLGAQMVSVAVGWQLYERTGSALALGLTGLFELAPVLVLSLPAGHAADRFRRRNVAMVAHGLLALSSAGLAVVSLTSAPVALVYGLCVCLGVAGTFRSPSVGSLLPQLVPHALLRNANAWITSGFQLASIAGPALGGFLIALTGGATWVYWSAAFAHLLFVVLLATLPARPPTGAPGTSVREALSGLRFVFSRKVFLAAITLDLFAVLFGGAVALLPIFAKDILQVGPKGLGWLRAAPALGAFSMAIVQTRLPPWKRPGRVLLWVVAGFGLSTIVFGLSRNFWLSIAMLALTGVFDNVSVVIRITLEQVLTPDELRGRVSAIHYIFVGFSNELGSFESGLTAALFGAVASVAGGGLATLGVVGLVAWLWPEISRLGPLDTLKAEPLAVGAPDTHPAPAGE